MPHKKLDLSGVVAGRLTAVYPVLGTADWFCTCSCGNSAIVKSTDLTRNRKRSCGCWQLESRRKNMLAKKRLFWPPTPERYPESAAAIFGEYLYLVNTLLDQNGAVMGLEDTAINLMLRACWIVACRASTDNPIENIKGYLCGYLFKGRAVLRNRRNQDRIYKTEEGGTMTESTLNYSNNYGIAGFSLPKIRVKKLKFQRR